MVAFTKLFTSLTFLASLAAAFPLEAPELNLEPSELDVNGTESDLDLSELEKRDSSLLIGYRSVSAGEAADYIKNGNVLTYGSKGGPTHRIDQLGPGAYLSPSAGEWPGQWVCAVFAKSKSKFDLLNKAWVPEYADDKKTKLWGNNADKARGAYLKTRGGSKFTTDNTMLLSKIQGVANHIQLLIPGKFIKSKKLDFLVNCADVNDHAQYHAIQALGPVNWYTWANVKGTPQH